MTMLSTTNFAATTTEAGTVEVIRTQRLSKSLDDRPVLRDLDLTINAGEYVAILGANGAGKSTLLRILATLIPPSSGDVFLFGEKLTRNTCAVRSRIGMIGHQTMLYRDLSARENLEFFGRLYGLEHPINRALELLEMIGLSDRATDPIKSYSRGMAQRVAIARALLHDPELVLADEPFDGLDAPSTESLEQLLSDLNVAGKTIVMVHHDIEATLQIAQRAIVLRDGRIAIDEPTMRLYSKEVLSEVY
jgi:heme exporter protein A